MKIRMRLIETIHMLVGGKRKEKPQHFKKIKCGMLLSEKQYIELIKESKKGWIEVEL